MSQEGEFNIRSAAPLGLRIDGLEDIQGLLGAAYSLDGLILHETDLGTEFFRLGSGVAGELFQTFVNFRLPVAVMIADFSAHGGRFVELAFEHSRYAGVRFVHADADALRWFYEKAAQ